MFFKRQYRNKTTITHNSVEAMQYTMENLNDVLNFVGYGNGQWNTRAEELWIKTHIGDVVVPKGFYVVKRNGFGLYALPQNVFHKIYEIDEK